VLNVGTRTECDQVIFSGRETSGVVTSPYYPRPYPLNVRCIYYIDGLQDKQNLEKVKLTINDIDIPPHSAPRLVLSLSLSLSVCVCVCVCVCVSVCLYVCLSEIFHSHAVNSYALFVNFPFGSERQTKLLIGYCIEIA